MTLLHPPWVIDLLDQLQLAYGQRFMRQWPQGIDPDKLAATWAKHLAALSPRAIAYGLDHLPPDPITPITFKTLCTPPPPPVLPETKITVDPTRVAALLAPLRSPPHRSPRQWAIDLQSKESRGERLPRYVRWCWRKALNHSEVVSEQLSEAL